MNNDSNNNTLRRGVVNGQAGTWVPVDQGRVPDTVSTDPNNPSVGTDKNFYYADPFVVPGQGSPYAAMPYANNNAYSQQYGAPHPISANTNNAIPTPSSIVQLPPIVQPISLVPYASQNQPLVQYDPNVRPEVPETKTPEPVYRRRPYPGISILVIIFSIVALLFGCLVPVGKTTFNTVINLVQQGQISELIGGNTDMLIPVVVGVLYALSFVFIIIVCIDAIVKLSKQKVIAKFNVFNLLALIFLAAGVALTMLLLSGSVVDCISAIVMAMVVLMIMLIVGFANREIMEVDYVASKQTFIVK